MALAPLCRQRDRSCLIATFVLLSACVPVRPADAYEPETFDGGANYDEVLDDAGLSAPPTPPPIVDAAILDDPDSRRLAPLAGRYLMRMDAFTKASTRTLLGDLVVKSRASNLLVARLSLTDGKLEAVERLCHQTFEHKCVSTCSKVESSVRQEAIAKARERDYARTYALDAGRLVATQVVMQLGFEDRANPLADPPTSNGDERVWDVYPAAGREGMMTSLTMSAAGTSPSCVVFNTQRHQSRFSGSLAAATTSLKDVVFELDTTGTAAKIIGAGGENAADCQKEPTSPPELLSKQVRFADVDDLSDAQLFACPAMAEFDRLLPPAAL